MKQRGIMRGRKVSRSITLTVCEGVRVVDGKLEEYKAVLYGSLSLAHAQKYLRSYQHDDSITISSVIHKSGCYEMELDDFLKHATLRKD